MVRSADRIVKALAGLRVGVAVVVLSVAGAIAAHAGAPTGKVPLPPPRPGNAPMATPVSEGGGLRLNIGKKNKQQEPPAATTNAPAGEPAGDPRRHHQLLQPLPHHGRRLHPVRAAWRAVGRHLPHFAAGEDPLPVQAAGQARRHLRRQERLGAQHAHDDAGLLPAQQDPAPLPPRRQHRPLPLLAWSTRCGWSRI